MPDEFSCKELARAWEMESPNHAGSQAWPFFRVKLKLRMRSNGLKFRRLCVLLEDEIEQERFESELPDRIARNRGHGARPVRAHGPGQ